MTIKNKEDRSLNDDSNTKTTQNSYKKEHHIQLQLENLK